MKSRKKGKARGVNTGGGNRVYTDEELAQYLLELQGQLGRIPTTDDLRTESRRGNGPSFRTYYDHGPKTYTGWVIRVFGKEKAKQKKRRPLYTDEQLVGFLKQYLREFGVVPTFEKINAAEEYPGGAVYCARGGIGKFLKLADLPVNKVHVYDDSFLINSLELLSEKLGRSPTCGDMRKARKEDPAKWPDLSVYFRRDTWDNWLKKAGLESVNLYKYSEEQLEEALRKAGEMFGRAPTSKEFDALEGFPGSSHYMRRGGWLAWLRRCGLQYEQPGNWFNKKITTKDGHIVKSTEEAKIDDWLFDNGIVHIYEPFYPGQKRYKADFKVGNTYYEYAGLQNQFAGYDQKLQRKMELAEKLGIKVVVILREQLNSLGDIFQ